MAHPKRRQSKTRTAKRRTHDKAVAPTLAVCLIVVSGMFTILYVALADTTEANLLLLKKQLYNIQFS